MMTDMKGTEMLIPLIFAAFGFLLAYFLRRGMNILLFGVFVYAVFKALEGLKYVPDWKNFNDFTAVLQQLGRSVLALITGMLGTAGSASILLFLAGGIAGLMMTRRRV